MFGVYILRCADGSYYTGHTDNLEKRIGQHHAGECKGYTVTRRPVELAWSQECHTGRCLVGRDANQRLESQEKRSHDARRLDGSFSLG